RAARKQNDDGDGCDSDEIDDAGQSHVCALRTVLQTTEKRARSRHYPPYLSKSIFAVAFCPKPGRMATRTFVHSGRGSSRTTRVTRTSCSGTRPAKRFCSCRASLRQQPTGEGPVWKIPFFREEEIRCPHSKRWPTTFVKVTGRCGRSSAFSLLSGRSSSSASF